MNVVRRFRLMTVRLTLLLTAIATGIAWVFDGTVARGILAGGLTGAIGFWVNAQNVEKLATMSQKAVNLAVYRWTFFRMGLYALTFYWAFTLDRESMYGLLGCVGGFFIVQIVLVFLGFTGTDLNKEHESNGTHR